MKDSQAGGGGKKIIFGKNYIFVKNLFLLHLSTFKTSVLYVVANDLILTFIKRRIVKLFVYIVY
jgi:hypothetical protein